MIYSFKKANVLIVIDKTSFQYQNQFIVFIQIRIIFDCFSNKSTSIFDTIKKCQKNAKYKTKEEKNQDCIKNKILIKEEETSKEEETEIVKEKDSNVDEAIEEEEKEEIEIIKEKDTNINESIEEEEEEIGLFQSIKNIKNEMQIKFEKQIETERINEEKIKREDEKQLEEEKKKNFKVDLKSKLKKNFLVIKNH